MFKVVLKALGKESLVKDCPGANLLFIGDDVQEKYIQENDTQIDSQREWINMKNVRK